MPNRSTSVTNQVESSSLPYFQGKGHSPRDALCPFRTANRPTAQNPLDKPTVSDVVQDRSTVLGPYSTVSLKEYPGSIKAIHRGLLAVSLYLKLLGLDFFLSFFLFYTSGFTSTVGLHDRCLYRKESAGAAIRPKKWRTGWRGSLWPSTTSRAKQKKKKGIESSEGPLHGSATGSAGADLWRQCSDAAAWVQRAPFPATARGKGEEAMALLPKRRGAGEGEGMAPRRQPAREREGSGRGGGGSAGEEEGGKGWGRGHGIPRRPRGRGPLLPADVAGRKPPGGSSSLQPAEPAAPCGPVRWGIGQRGSRRLRLHGPVLLPRPTPHPAASDIPPLRLDDAASLGTGPGATLRHREDVAVRHPDPYLQAVGVVPAFDALHLRLSQAPRARDGKDKGDLLGDAAVDAGAHARLADRGANLYRAAKAVADFTAALEAMAALRWTPSDCLLTSAICSPMALTALPSTLPAALPKSPPPKKLPKSGGLLSSSVSRRSRFSTFDASSWPMARFTTETVLSTTAFKPLAASSATSPHVFSSG
eukprot:CAMPEP_0177627052 /NCGR_PEP_ID=MMETSP0419_2-20121207/30994_1 /TAXON_ID=582737 /ORGANISM="Tetraselmis sp., Strain GSL018" /LENGTH=532 /DNA_ID=CAMNT_0019128173 /DNA_START=126 /DNA_END=1727 /DNA_ORIENTATION=+